MSARSLLIEEIEKTSALLGAPISANSRKHLETMPFLKLIEESQMLQTGMILYREREITECYQNAIEADMRRQEQNKNTHEVERCLKRFSS